MTEMMANTTAWKMQKPSTEKNEIQQSFKLLDVSSNELLNPNPKSRLLPRELSSVGVSFSEPFVVGKTVESVVVVVATFDEVGPTVVVVVVDLAFVDRVVDVVVVVVVDRVVDVVEVVVVDRVVVDRVVVDRVVVVTTVVVVDLTVVGPTVVVVEVVIVGLAVVVVVLGVEGRTFVGRTVVVVVVDVVGRVVVDPVSPSRTIWHVDRRHSSEDRQTFLPTFLITEFSKHSVNRL
jgi:hypothetical protein